MGRAFFTGLAASFALACQAFLVCAPAAAAVYSWVDGRGVVHMTDRIAGDQGGTVTTMEKDLPRPVSAGDGRRQAVLAELAAARDLPRFIELKQIVEEYRRTHSYSQADYFVCLDMALEMHNILATRKFEAQVVAGNVGVDTAGMDPARLMEVFDHAWVVVTLAPGVRVAVEATGGFVVDAGQPGFDYYYQGLVFQSPRQARQTQDLIHAVTGNCARARELIQDWNRTYVGRQPDEAMAEARGRVDAKVAECDGAQGQYRELITKGYQALY